MTAPKGNSMYDDDDTTPGERLIEGMKEIIQIERGEQQPARAHIYDGPVLVEVREHGKTVWTLADARLETTGDVDFATLRGKLRQSQQGMAALLGVPLSTVQNWDQGRRAPRGPAARLLKVAARYPGALLGLD